jgi:hypothetical protein
MNATSYAANKMPLGMFAESQVEEVAGSSEHIYISAFVGSEPFGDATVVRACPAPAVAKTVQAVSALRRRPLWWR